MSATCPRLLQRLYVSSSLLPRALDPAAMALPVANVPNLMVLVPPALIGMASRTLTPVATVPIAVAQRAEILAVKALVVASRGTTPVIAVVIAIFFSNTVPIAMGLMEMAQRDCMLDISQGLKGRVGLLISSSLSHSHHSSVTSTFSELLMFLLASFC